MILTMWPLAHFLGFYLESHTRSQTFPTAQKLYGLMPEHQVPASGAKCKVIGPIRVGPLFQHFY